VSIAIVAGGDEVKTNTVVDEVEQLLQDRGFRLERQVRFDWLTSRAPLEPDIELPSALKYRLLALHAQLGGDSTRMAMKRRHYLRFDLLVDDTTLIEVDESQHFTSARLTSLDFYDDTEHQLDVKSYRDLCEQYRESADSYMRGRDAVDFPFPGGRTAQRAYFDTTKDFLAAAHGYRLIRLPAPEGELTAFAELSLRVLL
jgi:hypothetical protein